MIFNERLKLLRVECSFTQEEAAKAVPSRMARVMYGFVRICV